MSRFLLIVWLLVFAPAMAFAGSAERAAQRERFPAVLALAERGPDDAWKRLAIGLEDYPLYPYLEYAELKRRLPKLERAQVEQFLRQWPDTLPARDLRDAYLHQLADRGDWTAFRALWQPGTRGRDLRCAEQRARIAGGEKPDYARDIEPLWTPLAAAPASCSPLFTWARQNGVLSTEHVRERIDKAAAVGNEASVRSAASLLEGAQRADAERLASALADTATALAKAGTWADTAVNRDIVSYGLARHARRNSAATETLWANLGSRFKWDAAQKNRVLAALATYRSTSYSDDALARLKALPADAADDTTREWHVRVALAAADWKEALAALDAMSDSQKADARWRYLRARVLVKLDRSAEANAILADVAREANFHGFLAADWLDLPYTICPMQLDADTAGEAALERQPDLARAFEFFALDKLAQARREWAFAIDKLDPGQQRLAADLANRRGWYDRAVFAFSANPDTQRLYAQRFPVAMESRVRGAARTAGVDPAWAYAIIRAESAWTTDARSHADAYGLMQLLPGVAKQVATAANLPYNRPTDLFDPHLNIRLGTRFLGQMAGKYQGSPWLASAAYNAGGAPVGRWIDARATLEPDFFIETIPYRETRDYVARVLAFSVLYDWRINDRVVPLSTRLPRVGQAYAAPSDQTARKAVQCPASTPSSGTAADDAPPSMPANDSRDTSP